MHTYLYINVQTCNGNHTGTHTHKHTQRRALKNKQLTNSD